MRLGRSKNPKTPELNRHRIAGNEGSKPNAFSYRSERAGVDQGRVPTIKMDRAEKAAPTAKRVMALGLLVAALIIFVVFSWVGSSPIIKIIQPTGFNYSAHTIAQYEQAAAKAIGSSFPAASR